MAGDWVKMRSDLYRDPKVCVIADALMSDGGALSTSVNQIRQRDMCVTRNVMRNVTVGALVSVWGVMRQRGKRDDVDLVCSGVSLSVIDDIADLPGFGDAMSLAGWASETAQGVVFPRFFEEYNIDPADISRKQNADRQRRFRERKKEFCSNAKRNVTRNVTVTPREEKRREESKSTPKSPTQPRKTPKPPESLEEVRQYIQEKELDVDAERFWNYFEAGKWHDSEGKPVLAWKQKILTWSNQQRGGSRPAKEEQVKYVN